MAYNWEDELTIMSEVSFQPTIWSVWPKVFADILSIPETLLAPRD